MTFLEKLERKWDDKKFVCVGLDPVVEMLPQKFLQDQDFFSFNKEIIDSTHDFVAAYKPNSAFYEGMGIVGIEALKQTIDYISAKYPDIVIILDAKRADIGNTNEGYVSYAFDFLAADAITVHPYLGYEALKPFFDRKDKGVFVLCRTSNSGSYEFQDLETNGMMLYEKVAFQVSNKWNVSDSAGLVVGATYPTELEKVRSIAPTIPILIPGIGAQGGDLEKSVKAAKKNFLISSSRGVIYASSGPDFAEAARRETEKLSEEIRKYL